MIYEHDNELSSARDDFENILCDSIARRIERDEKSRPSVASVKARAFLRTHGVGRLAQMYPKSFTFACSEMGIEPTLYAVDNLSREPE